MTGSGQAVQWRRFMGEGGYHLDALRSGLRPFRLYWFPRLRSTSDHAAQLRRRGELFAPAAVLAGRQTAGRGRARNRWWSDGGSVTVTFVLPIEEHLAPEQLALVAGLAVRNAAAEICGAPGIQLKWPNDVVYEGRKLAGVLCERVHKADLVGIGLNVNVDPRLAPAELRRKITSLSAIAGRACNVNAALLAVARELRLTLERRMNQPFAALVQEYARHHSLSGRPIEVTVPDEQGRPRIIKGECEGIDGAGRLLLRSGGEVRRITAGTVRQRRGGSKARVG